MNWSFVKLGAWVRGNLAQLSPLLTHKTKLLMKGERMSHMGVGDLGERIAARYLQRLGWKVLYRNFRAPAGGEVDLVMRGGQSFEQLVFVEVKTRTWKGYGRPLEAVDWNKQLLIERGANEWLRLLSNEHRYEVVDIRQNISWRFDVVEIILQEGEIPEVNLVENAF